MAGSSDVSKPFLDDCSLQHVLTCPIDLEPLKNPKVLQCGHSFCKSCWYELLTHNNVEGAEDITCPACSKRILIPGGDIENLPDNIAVKELLDRADGNQMQVHQNTKSMTCSSCPNPETSSSDDSVKYFCYNCNKCFCKGCLWKHKVSFRGHEAVVNLKFVTDLHAFCREHNTSVTQYCEKCSKAVCPQCVSEHHKYHRVIGITDKTTIGTHIADVRKC